MKYYEIPEFFIKKNLQKSFTTNHFFSDDVTPDILKKVCQCITGEADKDCIWHYVDNEYSNEFLSATYNKGRMAVMLYHDEVYFISFSEANINGRNSSVQSVPTAFNIYYQNGYPNKHLCYYFLNTSNQAQTDYQMLIYRLMKTVGFAFLNDKEGIGQEIRSFSSVDDIIYNRRTNAGRNTSNNSSYITKNEKGQYVIYGKTYGANKYETSLFCYAVSVLLNAGEKAILYEISEGNLSQLPQSSTTVLRAIGNVDIVTTDMSFEKKEFEENASLRSPRYIFNLLQKLGPKKCAFCGCEIAELIQGAHIWPVAAIKKAPMSQEDKLNSAIDGENGLWLCENHHKLFDGSFYSINNDGRMEYKPGLKQQYTTYIDQITIITSLPVEIMTSKFKDYLKKRQST